MVLATAVRLLMKNTIDCEERVFSVLALPVFTDEIEYHEAQYTKFITAIFESIAQDEHSENNADTLSFRDCVVDKYSKLESQLLQFAQSYATLGWEEHADNAIGYMWENDILYCVQIYKSGGKVKKEKYPFLDVEQALGILEKDDFRYFHF